MNPGLTFASDYMEGAHPKILQRLSETNLLHSAGYGTDGFSESARAKIREACGAPEADVFFLAGGTQTNATVIDALLRPWQGAVCAESGHIAVHEAGAVERGGHKVMTLPQHDGKIDAGELEAFLQGWEKDENREHMVMPGMVYISQPTEVGTLYSLRELKDLNAVCIRHGIPLYLDGARLAYALACPENDAGLRELARLCDVFYIGGTKCGALFGEAVVIPKHGLIPHFFTLIKQHGALLAKGRIAGIQFETLFTDGLYGEIGRAAIEGANRIRDALSRKGYRQAYPSLTNQIFIILEKKRAAEISREAELSFWENLDADHVVMRAVTSWATSSEDIDQLIALL